MTFPLNNEALGMAAATDLLTELVPAAEALLERQLTVAEWFHTMNVCEEWAEVAEEERSNYPEAEGYDFGPLVDALIAIVGTRMVA